MTRIAIVGVGMGNIDTLTVKATRLIEQADCLIGAQRLLESFPSFQGKKISAINSDLIAKKVREQEQDANIVILMSGDVGFFSGAKVLINLLKEEDVEMIAGISSLQYFTAKLRTSWDDAIIISMHGRQDDIVSTVRNNYKVFVLTDKKNTISAISNSLIQAGLSDLNVSVGVRLSYQDEMIETERPEYFSDKKYDSLAVMLICNANPYTKKIDIHGLDDSEFIRGEVPMTKSEVRSISLSKLRLNKHDIVYDIGAGTGSVSIEMGRILTHGTVYAIEINHNATALIQKNLELFSLSNVIVIEGAAPEVLTSLPIPDKAFIGGSKGNMDQILSVLLMKNPKIRVVVNLIAIESLIDTMQALKKHKFINIEIAQVTLAKAREVGSYHMMAGQNPIYIITAQGNADEK